jgi:hypothetical protein
MLRHNGDKIMDGWRFKIERLWLYDDVDRLHIKIDNLNNPLVEFCFIRSIDKGMKLRLGLEFICGLKDKYGQLYGPC